MDWYICRGEAFANRIWRAIQALNANASPFRGESKTGIIHGRYVRIEMVNGRIYREVLGLEIVAEGSNLRLYDPVKEEWLLTPL